MKTYRFRAALSAALCSLALFFLTCKSIYDNDPVSGRERVAGRVLEYGTETPLAGAEVTLSAWSGSLGGAGGSAQAVQTVLTDAEGRYSFTGFDPQAVLLVNARKVGYFTDLDTEESVNDGSYQTTDIHLPPYAWLEVTLKNESGAYLFSGPSETYSGGSREFYLTIGQDTSIAYFRKGNMNFKFLFAVFMNAGQPSVQEVSAFKVTKDGNSIEVTKENSLSPWFEVYLSGHDTSHVTIVY